MAKLSENILAIFNAVGLQLTEEQQASINKIESESDGDLQAVFDTAKASLAESLVKLERKGRSEAYDSVDTELLALKDLLGDALEEKVRAIKGPKKIGEIKAMMQAKLDEAQKAAAKGNTADVTALQNQLTELQKQLSTKETEFQTKLDEQRKGFIQEGMNRDLMRKLTGRKDLIEAYANEKAISRLLLPELLDYAKKKGVEITPEQLDVIKADTQTPYSFKDGKQVDIDGFIGEFVMEAGYQRKSDAEPPKSTVTTQTPVTPADGFSRRFVETVLSD